MTLLTIVAIWSARLPIWVELTASVGVSLYAWPSFARLYRQPVAAIGWQGDGVWVLRLTGGDEVEGRLCSARLLGPVIVLRLAWEPDDKAALFITPDNLDGDTRRRLRMRLSANTDKS